ncbi:MAG: transposase [Planctomycetota bacterium]
MPSNQNSHRLRIGRQSLENCVYSITKVVDRRRPLLVSDAAFQVLADSWQFLREAGRIKLFAFCVMPDHFHVMIGLMPGPELSKVVQDNCKFTARELNRLHGLYGSFWQHGFHDRRCRSHQEVVDLATYIEHNPVRAGLVESATDWCHSSAFPGHRKTLDADWLVSD